MKIPLANSTATRTAITKAFFFVINTNLQNLSSESALAE
jgi:hypothetical protein